MSRRDALRHIGSGVAGLAAASGGVWDAVPAWASEIDCSSWAQLLLKFVVSHPAITCAIPATARVAHLRDNMQGGYGRLPDEQLRARIVADAT